MTIKKLVKFLTKHWLLVSLAVMLVLAGWQYRQVIQQRQVIAGSGCYKEPDKGECEVIDGCKWVSNDGAIDPGSRNGRCIEDGGRKRRRRPSPSPSPNPSVSPSPSPSASPSPSPSVSPSPSPFVSPSPVPSPSPDTASVVIRKFNDKDKDGSWDSNETPTGRDWSFQYRFNDGEWQDYIAWGNSGWGGIVTVGQGTKVEVNEIEQDGWTNTTGLTLIKILEENKVYYFDFGNFQSPEIVEASPPPVAPEAGIGFR